MHIPFCRHKCVYCDFFSITDHGPDALFLTALGLEAGMIPPHKSPLFDTIYIGGGTPSLLSEKQVSEIMGLLLGVVDICTDNEITIEANPESIGRNWLKTVRQSGINRISIGIQSFNDNALAFLGRIHDVRQAVKAYAAARAAGFSNIGLDLIYGLPGQTRADLETDLNQAVALEPDHISCYMLTVEPGTPLAQSLREKRSRLLSESRLSDMFLTVSEVLSRHGFFHYEISNFARTAETCSRHNLKYWRRLPYIGLGPSAHSSILPGERHWNVKNVTEYVDRLSTGRSPRLSGETLSTGQQMMESVLLGLRLAEGIKIEAFNRSFGVDFQTLFAPVLSHYQLSGMLSLSGGCCRLSPRGMLFHETIAADLVALI